MSEASCTKCGAALNETLFNQPDWTGCPSCSAPLRVEVFPALFKISAASQTAQAVVTEGEASCFYHPNKRAALPCDACGRFLCALCDVELNGQHFCPACFESGQKKGRLSNLDNRRTRYDSLALTLALVPLIVWPVTVITAPAVLVIAIRYWKMPGSIVRRSRIQFVFAIGIALLEIVSWVALLWNMIAG